MEALAIVLIVLGSLGCPVSLIVLIVQAIRRKRKKPWVLSLVGFIIILFVGTGLGGITGQPAKEKKPVVSIEEKKPATLEYTILNEDVYDAPIKTQVELNILLSGEISETGLKTLLNQLYSSTKARKDFKYHDCPTNIYIYAFTSKERAESGMGQWIAMLQKSPGDAKATISINERQIAQLGSKPEERFGLSEEERKEIWKELVLVEDRAMEEALEEYPEQFEKQAEMEMRLIDDYKNKLSEKYELTREQLQEISVEGVEKDWPFPRKE